MRTRKEPKRRQFSRSVYDCLQPVNKNAFIYLFICSLFQVDKHLTLKKPRNVTNNTANDIYVYKSFRSKIETISNRIRNMYIPSILILESNIMLRYTTNSGMNET